MRCFYYEYVKGVPLSRTGWGWGGGGGLGYEMVTFSIKIGIFKGDRVWSLAGDPCIKHS